jgi:hypothetical protein
MGDPHYVAGLVEALARKNRIEDPFVARVGLEVRTSIGFSLKAEDQAKQVVSDRAGLDAFRVVWEYRVAPDDLNDFHASLLDNEPQLLSGTSNGPIRYLGTYLVKQTQDQPPLFVTTWGCPDADTALRVAAGPWTGPAGAEDVYPLMFQGRFDHGRAERVTSQGLAAAAAL